MFPFEITGEMSVICMLSFCYENSITFAYLLAHALAVFDMRKHS